jgi:putative hydrolase of the HAD superfamily
MPLPKVLLLDLDDTIVTFSATKRNFWLEAHEIHRHRFQEISVDDFLQAIRAVERVFWSEPERAFSGRMDLVRARRHVATRAFERVGLNDNNLAFEVADYYTWEKEKAVAPFPKAIETLEALRANNIRLGLLSNGSSSFQRQKLSRYNLERFFEVILIEGELGFGKPEPRFFSEALDRLGVPAGEAWMVGDNLDADIAGAKRVGLFAVWNDHAGTGLSTVGDEKPDKIIRSISELLSLDFEN